MNWVMVVWSMVVSACLTLAMMQLMIWCSMRTARANLLFSLSAAATAAAAGCELWMMRAETAGEFGTVLRWGHVPFWVLLLSLVGFTLIYMRAGRLWLAWTVCGLRTLSLILNFVFTPNLNYRGITVLRHVRFLGESVSIVEGIANPWMLVGQTSLLLFLVFLVDVAITMWRRGERRSLLILSCSMAFFIAASMGQYILVFWGISPVPITTSLFFLGVVAVMSSEMTRETLRAAQLFDDIRKNQEWLDLAADSAGVGLWLWDFKTNIMWATERARMLYDFSPDELISSEKFLSKLHPDDLDWVVHASERCAREGADFRYDYRIVLPDGSIRWLRVLAKVLLMPTGAPERMTGVSIDITGPKQMEQELQQKRNELTHVTRVSTMGQLASTLAHELNQPLGAILRNAEAAELFLQDPSPDFDELRAILADIRKDDQRAGAVIDRMRTMMRQREAERCRLDLNLITGDVISLVQSDADKRQVRLELDIDPVLPSVPGDRVQLQQVLINLLLNALDALEDNLPERRLVTVVARPAGAAVEVAVSDNGPGIAADKLLRVFEPFFSSKPNGLGMGLSISRGIIEAHGGRLWAKNNEAGGATFTITLPAAAGADAT
jgi:two-component system, LuxR family, sensor kinase FixL